MGPQRDRGCDATPAAVSSETRRMSVRSRFPVRSRRRETVWLALKDGFYIAYDCHNTKLGTELARKLDCRDQRFAPRSFVVRVDGDDDFFCICQLPARLSTRGYLCKPLAGPARGASIRSRCSLSHELAVNTRPFFSVRHPQTETAAQREPTVKRSHRP